MGETALGVLQILVNCEAQMEEASVGDDVVDAGHGIDTREALITMGTTWSSRHYQLYGSYLFCSGRYCLVGS